MQNVNRTSKPWSTSSRRIARRGVLLGSGIFCLLLLAVAAPVVTSQDDDYDIELNRGRNQLRRSQFEDALKSFKRANEMRDKKCTECLNLMAEAYLGLEAYKNAVETSDKVIELGSEDKQLVLKAYNNKGLALQAWAENKDQKKLQAAEAVFRQGLSMEGAPAVMRYNLGYVLLQLNRDQEGIAELQQYIKLQPRGGNVEAAKRLSENPRRARENYAPDFSFTSSEGEYVALEDLKGKVILLDFWGTWCPPCVESIPDLRNLHKKYSKEPSFMLIGISSDGDEDVWREFTAKNKMIWPQYRDKDHKIRRAFGIRAFPTYIIIDHEGIVRYQSVGMSWSRAASLDEAIRKQVKIVAKTTEAQ
ncbi:MAG TPA: redoxin domain-containing protein [Pyrinomonadaceae bacterium]|nr:redoxin domain-containing protein [Pyrinomonadaceae bacterium]